MFNSPRPVWVKLFAFPCHHQEPSGLVPFWHFLHLLITPCGHYCNISLFHLREAESFLISPLMGVIINPSFSLLCHRLFVFCFQAQSLINHYFLLDYANGINSMALFLPLLQAFSGFLLRADISFIELSLCSGAGEWGGGDSKVRVASLLLREGCSCPDLPLLKQCQKWVARAQFIDLILSVVDWPLG